MRTGVRGVEGRHMIRGRIPNWIAALSLLAAICRAQDTEILYLSGTDKDHTVDWDFFCTAGRKSGVWTKDRKTHV